MISKNNNNYFTVLCQEKYRQFPSFSENQCQNILAKVLINRPNTWFDVLDKIIHLSNTYQFVFPSQRFLGDHADIGRQRTNQIIKYFCDAGILQKITREYDSCIYILHPMFKIETLRNAFKQFLPSLRFIPLIFLTTLNLPIRSSDATLIELDIIYLQGVSINANKSSIVERESMKTTNAIDSIQSLNLSAMGKTKLAIFPDEAITYSDKLYLKKSEGAPLKDPFGMFFSLCMDYCYLNDIRIDYSLMRSILSENGFTGEENPLSSQQHGDVSRQIQQKNDFAPVKQQIQNITKSKPQPGIYTGTQRGTPQPDHIPAYKKTWNNYSQSCRLCAVKQFHTHSDEEIKTYYLDSYRRNVNIDLPRSMKDFMGGMFSKGVPELDPD